MNNKIALNWINNQWVDNKNIKKVLILLPEK